MYYKIKAVNCGKKNCHTCPHKYYLYARKRKGKKIIEKYVCPCDKNGNPKNMTGSDFFKKAYDIFNS